MKRILSLGAGVQSTTVIMLAVHGEIPPIDAAFFADTGWEPDSVYRHLETFLKPKAEEAGIPLFVVEATMGSLKDWSLNGPSWRPVLPFYIRKNGGGRALMQRKCTRDWKINVLHAAQRKWLGLYRKKSPDYPVIEQLFGISYDEPQRMRMSEDLWKVFDYPLVDLEMTRDDCKVWMVEKGYPEPPRSACVICPFHRNEEWRRLRDHEPHHWREAVEADHALRAKHLEPVPDRYKKAQLEGPVYLHDSLRPLDEADIDSESKQLMLWDNECSGMCGV